MIKYVFILIVGLLFSSKLLSQVSVKGITVDENGQAIPAVTVKNLSTGLSSKTDRNGEFVILAKKDIDTILFSGLGFLSVKQLANDTWIKVVLQADKKIIDQVDVIHTGYYSLPKERLTGSFEFLNEKALQFSSSPNILERMDGLVNGLQLDRSAQSKENVNGFSLRIRGLSTIESSKAPLIIWDGFPFEGNIQDINPDNVANITVLKDAAASSIWGARAGNGVIVITSKQGKQGKIKFNYSGNVTVHAKPDLFYDANWLDAPTVMEIQKKIFQSGKYQEQDQTQLPEYVELLIKLRDNRMTKADFDTQEQKLFQHDLRKDALKYLYRNQVNQQQNLSLSGGGDKYRFYLSGSYQEDRASLIGNSNDNLALNMNNQYQLFKGNELFVNFNYAVQKSKLNGLTFNELSNPSTGADIYTSLVSSTGEYLSIPKSGVRQTLVETAEQQGLLDWSYNPLNERQIRDKTSRQSSLMIQLGIKQELLKDWNISIRYQLASTTAQSREIYDKDSYYVRDLVNRFMNKSTGQRVIPYGAILNIDPRQNGSQQRLRMQSDFSHNFNRGSLNMLVGSEISMGEQDTDPGSIVYDYDKNLWTGTVQLDFNKIYPLWLTGGTTRIPSPVVARKGFSNRDLSYYSNASYTHEQKYTLTASMRWDGSNLFGVKANQKGTPLWSAGIAWDVAREQFFKNISSAGMRFRMTYGLAGNMDRSQSSYPIISYNINAVNGLNSAALSHPGNPLLQWEQVRTLNIGLDWSKGILSGSVEPYWKRSSNLLGRTLLDPTTGVGSYSNFKINYADMSTRGFDVKLNMNLSIHQFNWNASLLYSYVQNRIENYVNNTTVNTNYYLSYSTPIEGKSLDVLYALPWHGLSAENGLPLIFINDAPSSDFATYYQNYDPLTLIDAGVSVAPNFMHLRNQLDYKGFSLGVMIGMRWGHVFRRSSMYSGAEHLFPGPLYHRDYNKRWEKPGDELVTIVPAGTTTFNTNLMHVFKFSEVLIEKADVIRLQQINFGYNLPIKLIKRIGMDNLSVFMNLYNIGILWRANKEGIDPDFPNADYPSPFQFTTGLRFQL